MRTRIVPLTLLVAAIPVWAQPAATTRKEQTVLLSHQQVAEEAGFRWGLTAQEWTAYEQIMRDRRGIWSPGLDPITALGVSANSAAERERYAELYVRTEFERTRKELAFQLAVDKAWARLYPDVPTLRSRSTGPTTTESTLRYALIVTPACAACDNLIERRLQDMLSEAEEGVDIHVVGTGSDDTVLRTWLADQPDLLRALKAGQATVNHGSQFDDLASFPAIYAKTEDGQWVREL